MLEYACPEDQLRQYYEKWLHLIVWPLAFIPAAYLLVNQLYSSTIDVCWIAETSESHAALIIRDCVHALSVRLWSLGTS